MATFAFAIIDAKSQARGASLLTQFSDETIALVHVGPGSTE
ncbi:MAG TPA: hypothetical protein VGC77_16730 [Rhodopseudomonas sp.]